jgi:ABC-type nitrate/sulfonate/bicarbonate transport system substrate-binding protein
VKAIAERRSLGNGFAAFILAAALCAAASGAFAATKLRAGKAVGTQWAFIPLDVGVERGIFAKYGVDLDITVMTGEAKLMQGLTASSLDFGLAGSPGAALAVKGAPVIAVAALTTVPRNFSVVVTPDSPIHTIADLRGKLISGATAGGLPEWLVKHLAVIEGWGADGIRTIALGSPSASLAAVKTHQVDGMMTSTAVGYQLEERGQGRIITSMGDFVPQFHTEIVFARKDLVARHPELVRQFLKGLFASVAFIKTHKAETTAIAARVVRQSPAVMARTYDNEVATFTHDGSFDPAALAVLKESFVEMGILRTKPPDDEMLTRKFVPVTF